MKQVFLFTLIMVTAVTVMADTHVMLYDLHQGGAFDVTGFFQQAAGIDEITGITAVNTGRGEGDELLLITGDNHVAVVSGISLTRLAMIHLDDFRAVFGLGPGTGRLSTLTAPEHTADQLLYYDMENKEYTVLDFMDNGVHPYTGPALPEGFVAGFSFTALTDNGVLNHDGTGAWFYESFQGSDPVSVDFEALFDGLPSHLTEFEITVGETVFRYLVATLPGAGPEPTPTPAATATPGTDFDAVIAMGLDENLWTVSGTDYATDTGVDFTGLAPNQIVVRGDNFYVVNSRSNSLGIYSCATFRKTREIALGDGRNPFNIAFLNDDICFITNFQSNTVSRVSISAGSVETEIPLPAGGDLPHDAGITTYARPEGLVIVDGTCYVGCGNLDDGFIAGGPGVICTIDTASNSVTGWFETMGRNTVSVVHNERWPDWIWVVNAGNYTPGQGYTGDGNVNIYNLSQGQFTDNIPVNDAPFEIAFGPDRAYLASAMDGTIARITLDGFGLLSPVTLPGSGQGLNFVSGLRVGPDALVWVLEFNHDMLYLLDPAQDDARIMDIPVGSGPDALAFVPRQGQ